jgi:hypothetical protein
MIAAVGQHDLDPRCWIGGNGKRCYQRDVRIWALGDLRRFYELDLNGTVRPAGNHPRCEQDQCKFSQQRDDSRVCVIHPANPYTQRIAVIQDKTVQYGGCVFLIDRSMARPLELTILPYSRIEKLGHFLLFSGYLRCIGELPSGEITGRGYAASSVIYGDGETLVE